MQISDSYIFYRSWWELLGGLDRDTRDEVVCAINAYVFEGTVSEDISPLAKGVFMGIRMSIDLAKQKYEKVVEKRREAGKRGGINRAINAGQNIKANQANACNDKQTQANQADNVNDNDNDNDSLSGGNIIDPPKGESLSAEPADAPSQDDISYKKLVEYWNKCFTSHPNVPRLNSITGTRRQMTKARIGEYGKDAFARAIRQAANSTFLTQGDFHFTYDWFIKPNNFPKVLDGNYNDHQPEGRSASQPLTIDFYTAKDRYADGDRSMCWVGTDPKHQIITTIDEAVRCGLTYKPFTL